MKCLAVLGPGLIGGSVALSAEARGLCESVRIWARTEERAKEVASAGTSAFVGTDLAEVLAGAEVVVMATPVGVMKDLARDIVEIAREGVLAPGAVVTDVGSVKGVVEEEVRPIFKGSGVDFVGSHPMAGSERTGWENARADLFENAVCVITPTPETSDGVAGKVEAMWEAMGCRIFRMAPGEHDRAVARISHFPHVVAAAMVTAALEEDPGVAELSGNGFRDSSRVASGSPEMWTEILMKNGEEITEVLRKLEGRLGEVLEFFEKMDHDGLRRFLEEAKDLRDSSLHYR